MNTGDTVNRIIGESAGFSSIRTKRLPEVIISPLAAALYTARKFRLNQSSINKNEIITVIIAAIGRML